jgi:hypothetical protein
MTHWKLEQLGADKYWLFYKSGDVWFHAYTSTKSGNAIFTLDEALAKIKEIA